MHIKFYFWVHNWHDNTKLKIIIFMKVSVYCMKQEQFSLLTSDSHKLPLQWFYTCMLLYQFYNLVMEWLEMINMYMFTWIKRKNISTRYVTVQHHIGSSLRVWGIRESRYLIWWARNESRYAILDISFSTVHNINKLSNTKCSLSISDNY